MVHISEETPLIKACCLSLVFSRLSSIKWAFIEALLKIARIDLSVVEAGLIFQRQFRNLLWHSPSLFWFLCRSSKLFVADLMDVNSECGDFIWVNLNQNFPCVRFSMPINFTPYDHKHGERGAGLCPVTPGEGGLKVAILRVPSWNMYQ